MEMSMFNIQNGFVEALLRGLRSGFLNSEDYRRFSSCDNLEDLRTALDDSDYATFMQDEPSPLQVQQFVTNCKGKMAEEFKFLKSQSTDDLEKFMNMIALEKMIDNVCMLIQGTLAGKEPKALLGRMEPLGYCDEFKIIPSLDISQDGYDEVYRTILIDTPVGPYFEKFLQSLASDPADVKNDVGKLLDETDMEHMKNMLKKFYLEEFFEFTQELGGTTAEVMGHILKMEADFRTLIVTVNSLSNDGGEGGGDSARQAQREAVLPEFGYLWPEGTHKLKRANTEGMVRAALEPYTKYLPLFDQCRTFYDPENRRADGGIDVKAKSLEDFFFQEVAKAYELSFEQQFHFGVFYCWVKLREQETRNLEWIANMIVMGRKESMDEFVPIFAPRV